MYHYTSGDFELELEKFIQMELKGKTELNLDEYKNLPDQLQMNNHEICHEMFRNAYRGFVNTYIEMPNPRKFEGDCYTKTSDGSIHLTCSLITSQTLHYDEMIFSAIHDSNHPENKEKAIKFYRPYLFGYVVTLSKDQVEQIVKLEKVLQRSFVSQADTNLKDYFANYVVLHCSFVKPKNNEAVITLDGYVIQSASQIKKVAMPLYIFANTKNLTFPSPKTAATYWTAYDICNKAKVTDTEFSDLLESYLKSIPISQVIIYKIGNGNCIYVENGKNKQGFFYDIGFHLGQNPSKNKQKKNFNYVSAIDKAKKQTPSFVFLSHWDMDHITGHYEMRKKIYDVNWFAPSCENISVNAKRAASYLYLKGNLYTAARPSGTGGRHARLIGRTIAVKDSAGIPLAAYEFYIGEFVCGVNDTFANSEGIVIKYDDCITQKTLLMMGDVNYKAFNAARTHALKKSFAKTKIDYLVAPHHGSKHTAYSLITEGSPVLNGERAVFCCNNSGKDRPNDEHRKELEKRFQDVTTTEDVNSPDVSIVITL